MNPRSAKKKPNESESSEETVPYQEEKENHGWRRIVRNFTPSWFSVIMGTGIVSILLNNFPYNGGWLYWISVAIFVLNVGLLVIFSLISLLRYTLYPELWLAMLRHPDQSLFLGTFPMGLATIINMIVYVCVPSWGGPWPYIAWGLWCFDAVVSVLCCLLIPFAIMSINTTTLQTMFATSLLPIVPPIVAAGSGAIVASVLPVVNRD